MSSGPASSFQTQLNWIRGLTSHGLDRRFTPRDEQLAILNRIEHTKNDAHDNLLVRAHIQYRAQLTRHRPAQRLLLWLVSIFAFPALILLGLLQGLRKKSPPKRPPSTKKVACYIERNPRILPQSLSSEFEFLNADDHYELHLEDVRFLLQLFISYPLSALFLSKVTAKLGNYRANYERLRPQAFVCASEFSFSCSVLTHWCQKRSIEHINIMHGEKLFDLTDSYCSFDRFYVWSEFHRDLVQSLSGKAQFFIEQPEALLKMKERLKGKRQSGEKPSFTYICQGPDISRMDKIIEMLRILSRDYHVILRPHPIYKTKINAEELTFATIEDPGKVSIEESFRRSDYICGIFTTALLESQILQIPTVVDDVTHPELYQRLKDLSLSVLSGPHILLSQLTTNLQHKTSLNNELEQIERKHGMKQLLWNGEQIWPLLRIYYFYSFRNKRAGHGVLGIENTRRKLFKLKSALRGLQYIFKPSRVLVFSDDTENRLIEGKRQNKLFFSIFEALKNESVHYFESPASDRKIDAPNGNGMTTSSSLLDALAYALHYFLPRPRLEGTELLEKIQAEFEISMNDSKILKLHQAYRFVCQALLFLKQPRAIFLSESYSNLHMALIWAAKKRRIPTLELQHGIINRAHPAYNFFGSTPYDEALYPDFLLAWGPYVKRELEQHPWIPLSRIHPIGHSYIEYIQKNAHPTTKPEGQNRTALVTLQWVDQDRVYDFIWNLAKRRPDWTFHLLPRRREDEARYLSKLNLPNLKSLGGGDFYKLIQTCDLHVTSYSTTALEAPIFLKPNLLLDFDGMATLYFSRLLPAGESHLYTQSLDIAASQIDSLAMAPTTLLRAGSLDLVTPGFQENFRSFFEALTRGEIK